MEKNNIKKSCTNCKFFRQHYVIHKTMFRSTYCGDCMNDKFAIKDRRKVFPYIVACELWEAREIIEKEKAEDIGHVLKDIRRRLNEIAQILKENS